MFVSVKFCETDARSYTYLANEAFNPGDRVLVDVKGDQKMVFVDAIDLPEPPFTCKPIIGRAPEKAADPTPASEDALNVIAAIGHNNPPDPIDTITAAFDDDRTEAEGWLDGKPVENEAQMKVADKLRATMRDWRLALEKGQKSATAPLYDAYKAELERWKPTIEDAKRIEAGLVGILDGFKRKLAAEKAEADRLAQAAAWEATRKAQEAARLADATNIDATRAAAAAMAEAEEAQRAAKVASANTVKGMRWYDCHEILDHRAALHWIAANDKPAMTAFIEAYVAKNATRFPADAVRNYREQRAV